jgi:hypothetical protein
MDKPARRGLTCGGTLPWLLCLVAFGACDGGGGGSGIPDAGPLPLPPANLPLLACLEPLPPKSECGRDADCGEGHCVLGSDLVTPDRGEVQLRCGALQGTAQPQASCQEGADCESGLCGLSNRCFSPCRVNADCAGGQFCLPVEMRVGEDALAPVMACARNLAFEPDVRLQRGSTSQTVELGELGQLDLPSADGDSTQMLYLKPACGNELQVITLQDEGNQEELFDLDEVLAGGSALNPVSNTGPLVPFLVPNNPELPRSPERLQVSFVMADEGSVETLSASRSRRGNILDLNLFYVGGGADTVTGGFHPGSPEIAALMGQLRMRYATLGITLGEVREHDVVGALRDQFGVLEVDLTRDEEGQLTGLDIPLLDQLFELSIGLEEGGLNLFLIREMGDVLGVSGGIPGALGVHGTAASGVAIALDVTGMQLAPLVMLHEMSHQMGLFHTSEFNGSSIEPLADTPVCGVENDRDGDGLLMAAECRTEGGDNLMFWSGSGGKLSRDQIEILRGSVILR